MAKNFADGNGLEIWNGYQELPSPELASRFMRPSLGRLVSQYPYLFPVLAFPLYWLTGFYGLFLLNSIAFLGVVVLCYFTAKKLFDDVDLALDSCLILVLATFAWEYSQAAWPHVTALLFVMGALYMALVSFYSENRRRAILFAFGAGLAAGIAPGIRMDAVLIFPALVLPFLFTRPWRPLEPIAIAIGAAPGLLVLASTNLVKFGVFSPFRYGARSEVPLGLVLVPAALVLALWLLTRSRSIDFARAHRLKLIAAAVALIAIAFIVPASGTVLKRMAVDGYAAVVDIRHVNPNVTMPASSRSSGGGVVYLRAHKKALLQSSPYLVLLIFPLLSIARGDRDFRELLILLVFPATVVGFYVHSRHEYGGLCLNYRYFLPLLPFLSIFCAYAIRDIRLRWGDLCGWTVIATVLLLSAVTHVLLTRALFFTVDGLEFPYLVVPLILAFLLLGFLLLGDLLVGPGARIVRFAAWTLLIGAFTWAGLVAFLHDYPRHRAQRAANYSFGERMLQIIPADSILFTAPYIDPVMRLIEGDRVRIALAGRDRLKDFPRLLAFHLKAGRRAFAFFPRGIWNALKRGPLHGYKMTPVWSYGSSLVGEISIRSGDESGSDRKPSAEKPREGGSAGN